MSEAIAEARAGGARLQPACAAVGLTLRTYRRWHRGGTLKADARRREHRPETRRYDPPNRLSPDEHDLVLEVANAPRALIGLLNGENTGKMLVKLAG